MTWKHLKLYLILVLSCASATAQSQFRIGLQVGFNFATYTGEEEKAWPIGSDARLEYLRSFTVGSYALWEWSGSVHFRPEINYTQKGMTYSRDAGDADFIINETHTLNYVEIPLLLQYDYQSLGVFAGPYLAYFIDGQRSWERGPYVSGGREKYGDTHSIEKDYVKNLDYGIIVGCSYGWPNDFSLGLRYTLGLVSLSGLEADYYGGYDVRNSVIQLLVGHTLIP